MEALYQHYSHDFRDYSGASQKRRVLQALLQMRCASVPELQARVLRDPAQFRQLLEILTIPFSEMFRDPGFFLALRHHVVPVLRTYPSLKVWVAGCSAGEEAYSLAILLKEEGLLERSMVYATDINPACLERARQGVFAADRLPRFAANHAAAGGLGPLSDHCVVADGWARLDRSLCEPLTFADHSLATDSVFSETHLVCCRNVLIYFNRRLQDRALGLFHESLCHRGFLGLGARESLDFSAWSDRFDPVVKSERLFRKGGGASA